MDAKCMNYPLFLQYLQPTSLYWHWYVNKVKLILKTNETKQDPPPTHLHHPSRASWTKFSVPHVSVSPLRSGFRPHGLLSLPAPSMTAMSFRELSEMAIVDDLGNSSLSWAVEARIWPTWPLSSTFTVGHSLCGTLQKMATIIGAKLRKKSCLDNLQPLIGSPADQKNYPTKHSLNFQPIELQAKEMVIVLIHKLWGWFVTQQ